jgi:predicted acylesterase/phospholipase RssA
MAIAVSTSWRNSEPPDFYTLGVLKEIEGMLGCPLCKRFDLIFGTSTGSVIGALLALGCEVDQIHELYKKHVARSELKRCRRIHEWLSASGRHCFNEANTMNVPHLEEALYR